MPHNVFLKRTGVHSDHAQGRLNVHPNCRKPMNPVEKSHVWINCIYVFKKFKSHKEIPTDVLLALKHSKPDKSSSQVLQLVKNLHSLNKFWFTQKINRITFAAYVKSVCIFYRLLSHPPCKHGVSCRRQSLRQL